MCRTALTQLLVLVLQEEKEKEARAAAAAVAAAVSLAAYRPFFRELDLEVLSVLQCGLVSRSLLDSDMHTKVTAASVEQRHLHVSLA